MNKIAFLVPAFNEAKIIKTTLLSLSRIVAKSHIYVVDDGSKDNTSKLAKEIVPNVLTIKNGGKAHAMNHAVGAFKLHKKYKYIMPLDADTVIHKDFLKNALPILEKDKQKKVACVVGKVVGQKKTWINYYRLWEYEIAQTIHKQAQSELGCVIVCPGCATVFRADIFNKLKIPEGTQIEDMDFTFLINRKKMGKIIFAPRAQVITQDPETLRDLIKQLNRWYMGFWVCLIKHNVPWGGQLLDLEVTLLALEGLFNGLLSLCLIFLVPLVAVKNPGVLLFPIGIDLFLFMLPTMFFAAHRHKMYSIFKYVPHFYMLRFITSLVFLKSFSKVVLGLDLRLRKSWNTKRYKISWLNLSQQ